MGTAVLERLIAGRPVDLRIGDPSVDGPAQAHSWGPDRDVPADVLADLLTAPLPARSVRRQLDLTGARIVGSLDLGAAILTRGLLLRECVFLEPMMLEDAEAISLVLTGSHIRGIGARRMTCRGPVRLSNGFVSDGQIDLSNSGILDVNCEDGTIRNPGGTALSLYNCVVERGVYLNYGFESEGRVALHGTRIGGALDCSAGTFRSPGGEALSVYAATVGEFVYCNEKFAASGRVTFTGARIGGSLECEDGLFSNPGGIAMRADNVTVEHDLRMRGGFAAEGQVVLRGARIEGTLDCRSGSFRHPSGVALTMRNARVGTGVVMTPSVFDGELDLRTCKVGFWSDDPPTWPGRLRLRGFTLETLDSTRSVGVHERLLWISADPDGYHPQPYEQLAAHYRHEGDPGLARAVLVAKQRHRRSSSEWTGPARWVSRAWSLVLRSTIGYGYRPWLAAWPAALLLLAGWFVFRHDHNVGLLIVTDDQPSTSFSAFRYTVDALFPLAELGERARFAPVGSAAWHVFAANVGGWLLAAALVAGAAGVFKRDGARSRPQLERVGDGKAASV